MAHFLQAFQSLSMGRLFSLMNYSEQIIFKMVFWGCFQCKYRGPISDTSRFPELAFLGKKSSLVWHFYMKRNTIWKVQKYKQARNLLTYKGVGTNVSGSVYLKSLCIFHRVGTKLWIVIYDAKIIPIPKNSSISSTKSSLTWLRWHLLVFSVGSSTSLNQTLPLTSFEVYDH